MARWLLALVFAALCVPATAAAAKPCAQGYVGLTFDDGPTRATAGLLDVLQRHDLRATMFNVGTRAAHRQDDVRAQLDAGMWVGNHTYSHEDLTELGRSKLADEIFGGQAVLGGITGRAPTLFRPPLMVTNKRIQAEAERHDLTEVLATVDSRDYLGASVGEIVRAARTLEPGGIMLMHDYAGNTRKAIPRIARTLAKKRLCAGRIRSTTRDIPSAGGTAVFHAVAVRP